MHLRTLAIHGFKSFSQRTQLDFEPGITAVVGPNGSGKSNLADAFRWVLGEQSLRALRGRKTEDVLFAGTSGRPPAGMAEVQLIFDTASPNGQVLSVPYAELSVVRRAYRSGESEYYVNRERSRLRDVVDLFGRFGLGLEGFGLVGQGAMDAALSLRAEDRRALIEQAAAIGHLNTRLDDARERLDQTRANLARIADLIAEVAPRRDALARQAAQVRERAELSVALEAELLHWHAHQLVAPRRRLQQAEQARARLREELRHCQCQFDRAAGELTAARRRAAEIKETLTRARGEADSARTDARALAQRIALAEERQRGLTQRTSHTEEQLARLREELAGEEASIGAFVAERDALLAGISAAESELAALEREAAGWEEEKSRRESDFRHARRRMADLEAHQVATSSRAKSSDENLRQLEASWSEREARRAELARELTTRQDRVAELTEPVERARAALVARVAERQERSAEVEVAKSQVQQLTRQVERFDRDLAAVRARVEALRAVEEAGTAYFTGVRAVLQASRGPKARLTGVVGVVARLLVADRPNELAVETALGGHAQDLVVERWSDAEAAISFLKAGGIGRATFLPLDTLRPSRRQAAPTVAGVVGLAAELVQVDARYQLIADYLLGQTLIVETLAVARQVLRDCPPSWQIVTREGDLSRASGVVTGGAPAANRGSLSRHREQRDGEAKLTALLAERSELARRVAVAQESEAAATAQFNQTLREVRIAEETARQAEVALSDGQRQLDRASQNLTWHADELRRLDEQRVAAQKAQTNARAAVASASRELAAAREQVQALEAAVAAGRPPRDLLAEVYDKRAQRDVQVERARAVEAARKRQESRLGSVREQIRQMDERARTLASEQSALETERAELGQRHDRLGRAAVGREERAEALQNDFREAEGTEQRAGAAANEAEAAYRKVETELREAESSAERASIELAALQEAIRDELAEPDGEALAAGTLRVASGSAIVEAPIRLLANPQATRERIRSLRDRVQQLPSNPEILREFEAVCERLRFLDEQLADLGRTATTLTEAIEETRDAMRSRFGETFGAVSVAFERRFGELFGGGTARLSLDGDDDHPGVEIFAQPPGKRSQSLSMLSGGERALTAAALLFSLIETNPPPFCVLDEVDAALDENNVARFGEALQGLSKRTQFVVITHNRRTMEVASAIYGLTLENRGESRVLSLKLPTPVVT